MWNWGFVEKQPTTIAENLPHLPDIIQHHINYVVHDTLLNTKRKQEEARQDKRVLAFSLCGQ
jgi:hypothetical protein